MRVLHLLMTLLLTYASNANAQEICFDQVENDLGDIDFQTEWIRHSFNFKNTGTKILKIDNILVSCGAAAQVSKREFAPGEEGSLTISYHTKYRPDTALNIVTELYTNSVNKHSHIKGLHNLILKARRINAKNIVFTPNYSLTVQSRHMSSKPQKDQNSSYDRILTRYLEHFYQVPIAQTDETIDQLTTSIRRGGYWLDIDYDCFCRTRWEPINHITNLRTMAVGYTDPRSKYYHNDTLRQIINDGLTYWNNRQPKSHNWWHNVIGSCHPMTELIAMMTLSGDGLSSELKDSIVTKMLSNNPMRWTGANRVDIASYQIFIGALLHSDSIVLSSSRIAFEPVKVTFQEGLQADLSFHQHGNQLYTGGYGIVFVEQIVNLQYCLQNTPYQMESDQWRLFSDFFLQSFLKIFRGPYIDYNTLGRGITRKNNLNRKSEILPILYKYQMIDADHQSIIRNAIARFERADNAEQDAPTGNINFWRSDYMLHNRKHFQASVRAASNRVLKVESGNGDNLLGEYLTNGSLYFVQRGDEFYNIFPVWEWDKIPGVTSNDNIHPRSMVMDKKGETSLVGGVSDGSTGCFIYQQDDENVRASKSYFFFNDKIIVLGSDIVSKKGGALHTTVNQCHLRGNVCIKDGSRVVTLENDRSLRSNNIKWVIHDQVGYVFPDQNEIGLKLSKQSGSWLRVDYNAKDSVEAMPVFNLIINHRTKKSSFAYIIVPNVDDSKVLTSDEMVKIIANNGNCQAVYSPTDNQYQINFFENGTLKTPHFNLSVDRACCVIVKQDHRRQWHWIANDPTQHDKQPVIRLVQQ